ncbi:hypothetical protein [Morganella morganii]|uniref:hypothetical protein n=1 Tax=Morganella morganii TaxID=582 RepID=UPI001FFD1119|nr:hypothetical protein [Morganella morganii]
MSSINNKVVPLQDKFQSFTIQSDDEIRSGGGGDGGGNMESRVSKLEADVGDIKTSMALLIQKVDTLAGSISDIKDTVSKLPTSEVIHGKFSLVESKLTDLNEKVSKKASEDQVKLEASKIDTKIGGIKIWFLTILLFSIASPIIMLLINLYIKK